MVGNMSVRSDLEAVLKRIREGRGGLDFGLGNFATGKTQSVSGIEDSRAIRDGLNYLSGVEHNLDFLKLVCETRERLRTMSAQFLEGNTSSIRGEENRRRISDALASLELVEEDLSTFLSTLPPFSELA